MFDVIGKAVIFILFILLGYGMKKRNLMKSSDYTVLSTIVMNITLPCAIISKLNGQEFSVELFLLFGLGILVNLLLIASAFLFYHKRSDRIYNIVNLEGFNIGCFALPFVSGFFPPVCILATCLFDAGNAIMCLGGSYGIAAGIQDPTTKFDTRGLCKSIFTSVSILCYIALLVLSCLHLSLPSFIIQFTDMAGGANSFLSMFMLGVALKLHMKKSQLHVVVKSLLIRYGIVALCAFLAYQLLPLSLEVRQAVVIVMFAPVSAMNVFYSKRLGYDGETSAAASSSSILISLCMMTLLTMLFFSSGS